MGDRSTADSICNFNRHYAEHSGYFLSTQFLNEAKAAEKRGDQMKFYDSNTGALFFWHPWVELWMSLLLNLEHMGGQALETRKLCSKTFAYSRTGGLYQLLVPILVIIFLINLVIATVSIL